MSTGISGHSHRWGPRRKKLTGDELHVKVVARHELHVCLLPRPRRVRGPCEGTLAALLEDISGPWRGRDHAGDDVRSDGEGVAGARFVCDARRALAGEGLNEHVVDSAHSEWYRNGPAEVERVSDVWRWG